MAALVRSAPGQDVPPYVLRCQEDSHQRELLGARVVRCCAAPAAAASRPAAAAAGQSDSSSAAGYHVQLSDTVLFPEGGGQPHDHGALVAESGARAVPVARVERLGDGSVVHHVAEPLPEGSAVDVRVDWARRFDHMQCHSAQHLITALALQTLGRATLGWSLTSAPEPCYVDLAGAALTGDEARALQERVNACVVEALPFSHEVVSPERFAELRATGDVRFKAMPDAKFPVRIVSIAGLDSNTCCGTHVSSTAELQAVKILHSESLKGGSISRTYFVAGGRLVALLDRLNGVARELSQLLGAAPERHGERVAQLVADSKADGKTIKTLHKDVAELLGPKLAREARHAGNRAVCYHRADGTPDFIDLLLRSVERDAADCGAPPPPVVLVTTGDEAAKGGGAGALVLQVADAALLKPLGDAVIGALGAKGGGRGTKLQAKILAGGLTAKALQAAHKTVHDAVEASSGGQPPAVKET